MTLKTLGTLRSNNPALLKIKAGLLLLLSVLPHELFVGDLAVRYGDAAAFLVTGAAADDVLPLNLHYPHRGFHIFFLHNSFFYWVATLKILQNLIKNLKLKLLEESYLFNLSSCIITLVPFREQPVGTEVDKHAIWLVRQVHIVP